MNNAVTYNWSGKSKGQDRVDKCNNDSQEKWVPTIMLVEEQFLPVKPLCKVNNKATGDLPTILPLALQPKQWQQKHQCQNDPILGNKSHQTHRHELAIS